MPGARAKFLARSIVAVFSVTLEEIGVDTAAGGSADLIRRELRPVIGWMIDQIEHGRQCAS